MFGKQRGLAMPGLLAAIVGVGAVISGVAVGWTPTRSDATGRPRPPAAASFAAIVPASFEAPATTQPPSPENTPAPPGLTDPSAPPDAPPPAEPAPAPPPAAPAEAPSPPPPAPAIEPPAPSCSGGGALVDAMNRDRAANGVAALCGNSQLAGFAQGWANWMAQNLSLTHENIGGLIGSTPFRTMGQNILVGPATTSIAQMEAAFMNSPDHVGIVLSGSFTAAGSGSAVSSDGQVWVCVDFGG